MKAFINEIVMKHLVEKFAPGVMAMKKEFDKSFGDLEEDFNEVIDGAKLVLDEVSGWVEKKVDMLGLTIFGLCGCVFLILFGCYWCFYKFIDTKCGTLETGALETDIVLDYGVRR